MDHAQCGMDCHRPPRAPGRRLRSDARSCDRRPEDRLKRGRIANRRSVAVGNGRRTIPTTVVVRPSVRRSWGIPEPLADDRHLPRTDGRRPASDRRACGYSIRPVRLTSRHSWARPGWPCSTVGDEAPPSSRSRRSARKRGAPYETTVKMTGKGAGGRNQHPGTFIRILTSKQSRNNNTICRYGR